jgi:YD repeat-containing protein
MRPHHWLLFVSWGTSCSGQITGAQIHKTYTGVDTSANQKGRLTTSGNSDSRAVFGYDALGRALATEFDREGGQFVFRTTYGYAAGAGPGPGSVPISQEFPDHELVRYGYDASGAQVSIVANGDPIVRRIIRNARGQTVQTDRPSGLR